MTKSTRFTDPCARSIQILGRMVFGPYAIDPDAVLRAGMVSLRDLPRLLDAGTIEERTEFVRAFVAGVTVQPDDVRLDVQMRQIPVLGTGNSACEMVAGARYEPVQMNLEPAIKRFVAGLRLVA
jgi:hypothetical protein